MLPTYKKPPNEFKLHIGLGDWYVGKTCLGIRYAYDSFPEEYVPTVMDNYSTSYLVGENNITLQLW